MTTETTLSRAIITESYEFERKTGLRPTFVYLGGEAWCELMQEKKGGYYLVVPASPNGHQLYGMTLVKVVGDWHFSLGV